MIREIFAPIDRRRAVAIGPSDDAVLSTRGLQAGDARWRRRRLLRVAT
jgi:hypothetical protein